MSASPTTQPPERRLSAIDQFCIQTKEAAKTEAARQVRAIASTLGIICLALLLCLGLAVFRANAMEVERDQLVQELRQERAARLKANLAAKDVQMNVATYALDTRVRRDIVDEQMLQQQQRSEELEQLAAQVERDKLVKADCITPRSILNAAGL